jgi:hypothetical protein
VQDLDHVIAFAAPPDAPPLEVRVNFGMFAGREATPAEIDDLARELIPAVGDVTIVREERHEISGRSEGSVQQVKIELPRSDEELVQKVIAIAEKWAAACIAERHAEVTEQ